MYASYRAGIPPEKSGKLADLLETKRIEVGKWFDLITCRLKNYVSIETSKSGAANSIKAISPIHGFNLFDPDEILSEVKTIMAVLRRQ